MRLRHEAKVLKKLCNFPSISVVRRKIAKGINVYFKLVFFMFLFMRKENPSAKERKTWRRNLHLWTQQLVLLAREWLLHKSVSRRSRTEKTWSWYIEMKSISCMFSYCRCKGVQRLCIDCECLIDLMVNEVSESCFRNIKIWTLN